MTTFTELLSHHAGTATARQIALGDVIGDASWGVDMGEGTITFGDRAFAMQVLGTEADGDGTWLWGWANAASGIPEPLLAIANEMRALGEREGIAELTERSFPIERANGYALASIAAGSRDDAAFYRAPYAGGALYVVLPDAGLPPDEAVPDERVVTTLAQTFQQFDVDKRLAAQSFLERAGFAVETAGDEVRAQRGNSSVAITFDETGRVTNLSGTLAPRD